MLIFSKIFIIIKFGEKLRDIYKRAALDFPNPRLASWTDFNARRLRRDNNTTITWITRDTSIHTRTSYL
jgi:hypothetical protein